MNRYNIWTLELVEAYPLVKQDSTLTSFTCHLVLFLNFWWHTSFRFTQLQVSRILGILTSPTNHPLTQPPNQPTATNLTEPPGGGTSTSTFRVATFHLQEKFQLRCSGFGGGRLQMEIGDPFQGFVVGRFFFLVGLFGGGVRYRTVEYCSRGLRVVFNGIILGILMRWKECLTSQM